MITCIPGGYSWVAIEKSEGLLVLRGKLESVTLIDVPSNPISWISLFGDDVGQTKPYDYAVQHNLPRFFPEGTEINVWVGVFSPSLPGDKVILETDYYLVEVRPWGVRTGVGSTGDDFIYDVIEARYMPFVQASSLPAPSGDYDESRSSYPNGMEFALYQPSSSWWDSLPIVGGPWMNDWRRTYPGVGTFWELEFRFFALPMFLHQSGFLYAPPFDEYRLSFHSSLYLLSYQLFLSDLRAYFDFEDNGWLSQAGDDPELSLWRRQQMYADLEVWAPSGLDSVIEEPSHRFAWYSSEGVGSFAFTVEPLRKYTQGGGFRAVNGGTTENSRVYLRPTGPIAGGSIMGVLGTYGLWFKEFCRT